jgi:hypothetical protein
MILPPPASAPWWLPTAILLGCLALGFALGTVGYAAYKWLEKRYF